MAKTIEELKSLIDSAINTNGNRAITGKNLNIVLKETVDTVSSEIETSQSEVNTILDNLMGEVEELINQSSKQDDRLELHVNLAFGE